MPVKKATIPPVETTARKRTTGVPGNPTKRQTPPTGGLSLGTPAKPTKRVAAARAPKFSEPVTEQVTPTDPPAVTDPFATVQHVEVFDAPKVEIPDGVLRTVEKLRNDGIAVVITDGWTDGDVRKFSKLVTKLMGVRLYTKVGTSLGRPAVKIHIPTQKQG